MTKEAKTLRPVSKRDQLLLKDVLLYKEIMSELKERMIRRKDLAGGLTDQIRKDLSALRIPKENKVSETVEGLLEDIRSPGHALGSLCALEEMAACQNGLKEDWEKLRAAQEEARKRMNDSYMTMLLACREREQCLKKPKERMMGASGRVDPDLEKQIRHLVGICETKRLYLRYMEDERDLEENRTKMEDLSKRQAWERLVSEKTAERLGRRQKELDEVGRALSRANHFREKEKASKDRIGELRARRDDLQDEVRRLKKEALRLDGLQGDKGAGPAGRKKELEELRAEKRCGENALRRTARELAKINRSLSMEESIQENIPEPERLGQMEKEKERLEQEVERAEGEFYGARQKLKAVTSEISQQMLWEETLRRRLIVSRSDLESGLDRLGISLVQFRKEAEAEPEKKLERLRRRMGLLTDRAAGEQEGKEEKKEANREEKDLTGLLERAVETTEAYQKAREEYWKLFEECRRAQQILLSNQTLLERIREGLTVRERALSEFKNLGILHRNLRVLFEEIFEKDRAS